MYMFHMEISMLSIDAKSHHCNFLMDIIKCTFLVINKYNVFLDIEKCISLQSNNNQDYHIWYKCLYQYIKCIHLHKYLHNDTLSTALKKSQCMNLMK